MFPVERSLMLPLKDRIVLKQFKAPEKTKSGIILTVNPDSKEEKPNIGVVRFVGPDVQIVRPGMVVILGTKWFTNFKLGNEELLIVNEPDIIGIADRSDLEIFAAKWEYPELFEFEAESKVLNS